MTAFFKKKAVSQVDAVLIEGKHYEEAELKKIIKEYIKSKEALK